MSLTKSKGNMYPWVTHTHGHLRGACSHQCSYCYAQDLEKRYMSGHWSGDLRLDVTALDVNYGKGKTIFIEHMNDILAADVPDSWVNKIIYHCKRYPLNEYVFQSKNPIRFKDFDWPESSIFGTTIETNRENDLGNAPPRIQRVRAMESIVGKRFVTIEPVMDFDVDVLVSWIDRISPWFVNLGADSKNHNLPEPTVEKIMQLIAKLKEYGIELREKHNLQRLKP